MCAIMLKHVAKTKTRKKNTLIANNGDNSGSGTVYIFILYKHGMIHAGFNYLYFLRFSLYLLSSYYCNCLTKPILTG